MENLTIPAHSIDFGHIGWKYYNKIKKKAMEQEFSWSGLILSLSIAFFIVMISAFLLSAVYKSLSAADISEKYFHRNIYRLEGTHDYSRENYLQSDYISQEKIDAIRTLNLA
jgi:hypothetical protein